jgi:hypothetical protein
LFAVHFRPVIRSRFSDFLVFLLCLGFHANLPHGEFNRARPGWRNSSNLPIGVGSFSFFRTTPATILTIAHTGATLRFGQERSKVKTALTAEPCRAPHCSCTTQRSSSSLKEFQGPYNHPEGVDGAKIAPIWRNQTRSSARPSRTIAFSKNSVVAEWVWCTRLRTHASTDLSRLNFYQKF